MGVLTIKIWAVVPEGLLPCLPHQMGVAADCFLAAPHQHLVKRCYLPPLSVRGPLGSCLGCGLADMQDIHQVW